MDFWAFVGGYWWLAFPLLGAAGGVAGAWEKAARRRHKRRLEILKAKSELKAAQSGLRSQALTGATPADAAPESQAAQLERLFAAHDTVTARWLEYELDVAKLIAFPAMSDGRQPLTAAYLRAKRVADGLRPPSAKARLTHQELTEYRNAVTDYEVAFDVAERDARRIKDSSFTEAERKRLDTAQQLLTVAVDQAATPAERQLAYRRVREELDGLLSLSDEAIDVLEQKVALELPAGASSPRPDAAGPGAASSGGQGAAASGGRGARSSGGRGAASSAGADPRLTPPPAPAPGPPAREPKTGPPPAPSDVTPAPGRIVRPKPTP
ncbi:MULTISPECIES: hypothetical protein [Microbacterium]|uniref:Uncharacterized protein n=1 Tax=Microbacterium wangchenii TaxID=2541726 RepID=A0ABX5SQ52_9MICO|nr:MULTISPECIES: hypothetical protein [Microbacterium]MCK6066309.1 hypothetical protein [Microbacterium sp. EYE_512]QBR87283.1 hypothetical protein E4K62_00355 [Microbacterium wangchenii]